MQILWPSSAITESHREKIKLSEGLPNTQPFHELSFNQSPNSTVLTYFSELCEKTPLGEISLENFLTLPNNSQNGGNYSSAQRRIYFLSAYKKSLV